MTVDPVLPVLATTVEQLDDAVDPLRAMGASVAVVMTMGALHAGHVELIRIARSSADVVVVTIFVNPLQFGPTEDLDLYPRQLARDVEVCAREGAAVVFAPTPEFVYPEPVQVSVTAGALGTRLCGRSRPGHFDGVLTVVAKLFHLVAPDVAVFGEKDAQQLALIRRMVSDLNFAVELIGVPTVREPDGLALSSRNAFLSSEERSEALSLRRALTAGEAVAARGPDAVRRAVAAVFESTGPSVRLDYAELVDPRTLDPVEGPGPALLAVAAWVGTTRLIDNVEIVIGSTAEQARTHKEP